MPVAIFDLDHTLLRMDSDYGWGQYLIDLGLVNAADFKAKNDAFEADYRAGCLDIEAYSAFVLEPLRGCDPEELAAWRESYVRERIYPEVDWQVVERLNAHRTSGADVLIATSTNSFVTRPIADLLGVADLLATEAEMHRGVPSGRILGTPCHRELKVTRISAWLANKGQSWEGSWGYSDSHNDLPLLERVDNPVAVNPDPTLAAVAAERGWEVLVT